MCFTCTWVIYDLFYRALWVIYYFRQSYTHVHMHMLHLRLCDLFYRQRWVIYYFRQRSFGRSGAGSYHFRNIVLCGYALHLHLHLHLHAQFAVTAGAATHVPDASCGTGLACWRT